MIEITFFINDLYDISIKAEHLFLVTGSIAGLGLGSTQSACRAMVGMFSPVTKAGEFFGLWSFSNRLAAILGLLSLGILQNLFGLRNAILVCSIFFMTSVIIAQFINEERGREMALKHAGE